VLDPFYHDDYVTIYHGDCREILPELEAVDAVVTDPIWPNATVKFQGSDDPYGLFAEAMLLLPETKRLVVQLGCDSDPRFLAGVPASFPFLRVCWLDYARPSYKGRLLYTGDVAYAFGQPPAFIPGRQVMSGMCRSSRADRLFIRHTAGNMHKRMFTGADDEEYHLEHPSPRRLEHVRWLVYQFSDDTVLDPFAGSGTTLLRQSNWHVKASGLKSRSVSVSWLSRG